VLSGTSEVIGPAAEEITPANSRDPVPITTSEVIGPAAEDTKPANSREGIRRKRKRQAARALRKELERSVARITGHLKAAGATEEDIRAAFPGLVSARLALDPVELVLHSLGIFVLLAAIIAYIWLADSPEFVRRGGFLLYPLLWTSDWNAGLVEATRYVFGIGMVLGILLLAIYHNPLTRMRVLYGPTLAQQAAKRFKRLAVVESLGAWLSSLP
jgi:hypothetical protein